SAFPHEQAGSVPRIIPWITAAAHPTPAFTLMAPDAQFFMHAPHSMQESRSAINAFPPCISKTACGHTSMHSLQPVHSALFRDRVSPFFRYVILTARLLQRQDPGHHGQPKTDRQ